MLKKKNLNLPGMGIEPMLTFVNWILSPTPKPLGHPGSKTHKNFIDYNKIFLVFFGLESCLTFFSANKIANFKRAKFIWFKLALSQLANILLDYLN